MRLMTGNIVIFEASALMYIVISKAEKHAPYEELVGTTDSITL